MLWKIPACCPHLTHSFFFQFHMPVNTLKNSAPPLAQAALTLLSHFSSNNTWTSTKIRLWILCRFNSFCNSAYCRDFQSVHLHVLLEEKWLSKVRAACGRRRGPGRDVLLGEKWLSKIKASFMRLYSFSTKCFISWVHLNGVFDVLKSKIFLMLEKLSTGYSINDIMLMIGDCFQ